jgi:hypothetical protein
MPKKGSAFKGTGRKLGTGERVTQKASLFAKSKKIDAAHSLMPPRAKRRMKRPISIAEMRITPQMRKQCARRIW